METTDLLRVGQLGSFCVPQGVKGSPRNGRVLLTTRKDLDSSTILARYEPEMGIGMGMGMGMGMDTIIHMLTKQIKMIKNLS